MAKRAREQDTSEYSAVVGNDPPRWLHTTPDEVLCGAGLLVGQRVKIVRTSSKRPDLLGLLGVTTKYYPDRGLFKLEVDGQHSPMLAKPSSLEAASTRPIPRRIRGVKDTKWGGTQAAPSSDGGHLFPLALKDCWESRDGVLDGAYSNTDLDGFVAMEKYDGIRAMWRVGRAGMRDSQRTAAACLSACLPALLGARSHCYDHVVRRGHLTRRVRCARRREPSIGGQSGFRTKGGGKERAWDPHRRP
jgi:hypothetical protein